VVEKLSMAYNDHKDKVIIFCTKEKAEQMTFYVTL